MAGNTGIITTPGLINLGRRSPGSATVYKHPGDDGIGGLTSLTPARSQHGAVTHFSHQGVGGTLALKKTGCTQCQAHFIWNKKDVEGGVNYC